MSDILKKICPFKRVRLKRKYKSAKGYGGGVPKRKNISFYGTNSSAANIYFLCWRREIPNKCKKLMRAITKSVLAEISLRGGGGKHFLL